MANDITTEAEVTLPVKGKLAIALNHPTPTWAIWIVRALVWISGAWIAMGLAGKLESFGIPANVVERVGHIMPVVATIASIAARYLGIKPTDNNSLTNEEVPLSQTTGQPKGKPD